MRKLFLIFLFGTLINIIAVSAAEVCIVVQLEEDKVKGDCVDVDEGGDGYVTLEESDLDFLWSDAGVYGKALCKIEGKGDNVAGTSCAWGSEYWGFYIIMNDEWSYMPVGFDTPGDCWNRNLNSFGGHYCAHDGDVLGFRYGAYGYMPMMLRVENIKIYVDGKKSKADEEGGTVKDVSPEAVVEVKVKLENLYPDEVDIAIEDISIEGTIEEIDDGSDIEEESDNIDLDAEEDDELSMVFKIPLEVEEDKYPFSLTLSGEDEKGIEYEKTITYKLEVEKEKHQLKFLKTELYPETITCKGTSTLELSLANIGEKEEDVTLTITNNELDINIKEEFTLDHNPFDDDSKFRKKYTLMINDTQEKVYPINIQADYSNKQDIETVNLEIVGCEQVSETKTESDKEKVQKDEITTQKAPKTEESTTYEATKPSFLEKYATISVIAGILLIILVGTLITVVFVLRK